MVFPSENTFFQRRNRVFLKKMKKVFFSLDKRKRLDLDSSLDKYLAIKKVIKKQ